MFPNDPAPLAPEQGALMGPWHVLEPVNAGSFGIIYRVVLAADPGAGTYAMKLAATPADARFQREAELLSRVDSPHLPRFHDAGTWESGGLRYPYIVMQWGWRARMLARAGLLWAGAAAVALALVVAAPRLPHLQEGGEVSDVTLPPIAAAWHVPPLEAPDAGVAEETLLSVVQTPRSPSPEYVLSLKMPKVAFPGQRKPPCESRFEREVLGACWSVLKGQPPCGKAAYEYAGECLKASFDAPRQPTSEQP